MPLPTDVRICDVSVQTHSIRYRVPMKFGGRVVNDVVLADVEVEVETPTGRRGCGIGSMPVGNVWAWPSTQLDASATCNTMIELLKRFAAAMRDSSETGHPLQLMMQFAEQYESISEQLRQERDLPESIPRLAQLVSASPLDAALFDAQGKALDRHSYELLSADTLSQDLATWLGPDFRGQYPSDYVSQEPRARMPLYHLVGAMDPLVDADVPCRPQDTMPVTLAEWIRADGLTHLKIKLAGDDLSWDVDRVVSVERITRDVQQQRGCSAWHYSLDFNEKCASVDYLLEFLHRIEQQEPQAFERIQYLEQPTSRYMEDLPQYRMHEAAKWKPVVIDEALTDLTSLLTSRRLGYSGVALKACKGISESILMGAAAQKYGMFLCVQDLTCPGASFVISASLAAHIPPVTAIEGNARQYCPAGNEVWQDRLPGLFHVRDGTIETAMLRGPGLGGLS